MTVEQQKENADAMEEDESGVVRNLCHNMKFSRSRAVL